MSTLVNLSRTLSEVVAASRDAETPRVPTLDLSACISDTRQSRVMIVDDEPLNIAVVQGYLELDGYRNISFVEDAVRVLPRLQSEAPDVLLLDIQMPRISGLELLSAIRADPRFAMLPVIILTANSDSETKLQAFELGATDLLSKPVHQGELLARLRNILRSKACHDRLADRSEQLEEAVRLRTVELEISRQDVIHCLARAAEFRDDDTGQHVLRVGRYVRIIGEELGFPSHVLDVLEPAAQLHDVGKIGIPDSILLKPGKLTPEEFEIIQRHCGFGKQIVEPMLGSEAAVLRNHAELGARIMGVGRSPVLEIAKRIAMTHHERWDGTGYPLSLAGEDIPIEGRITAVADVFDALSSKRPYKPAFPLDKCFAIIEQGRSTHFDPRVLDAFLSRCADVVEVQINLAEIE